MGPSAVLDNSENRKIPSSARNLSRILSCQARNIGPTQTMLSRLLLRPKQTVLDGNRELAFLLYMAFALNHSSDTETLLMVRE